MKAEAARLRSEAARAGAASRQARATGDGIYGTAFNLDIKNPHTVEEDHGDPETLLAELTAAEAEAASQRDALKAILTEALTR